MYYLYHGEHSKASISMWCSGAFLILFINGNGYIIDNHNIQFHKLSFDGHVSSFLSKGTFFLIINYPSILIIYFFPSKLLYNGLNQNSYFGIFPHVGYYYFFLDVEIIFLVQPPMLIPWETTDYQIFTLFHNSIFHYY